MKTVKKIFKIALVLLVLTLLFRAYLYRGLVAYKNVGQRPNYLVTDKTLQNTLLKRVGEEQKMDIKDVISTSLSITSAELHFTAGKNDHNPNKLIYSKSAHCVGYAAFFAATCNYLLKEQNLANEWVAKPKIGQLYFLGVNVHPYFKSPFFKDHDFVCIENLKTGEKFAVDPTVHDYFWIDFVKLKP